MQPGATTAHPVGNLHRTVTLLTAISLFVGTLSTFDALIWRHPWSGIIVTIGYGGALLTAVLSMIVRNRRTMLFVDVGVLIAAAAVRLPTFFTSLHTSGPSYVNDEGALIDFGASRLHRGLDPYTGVWPGAYAQHQGGFTQTMAGGVVDRFDYPPLTAVYSWFVHSLAPSLPAAAIVGVISLLASTILLFILLPAPWKSAGTLLCLGLGIYLMPFARQGYPEMTALPFLIVAVHRWTRIGVRGRLGALGIISAVCLGLAVSTQQLAWFLAPFLILGILLCRLGDQPRRSAWGIAARYTLVVSLVAGAANGPFIIWNAKAWLTAMLTPVSVATVPKGEGLIAVTYYVVNGSGALNYLSYASMALAVGLLICFALFIRRLGPAMSILPWTIFLLSVRASDKYFYIMMPIWFVCLATVPRRDFATAFSPHWHIGRLRPLDRRWGRVAVTTLVLAPAVLFAVIGVATPQPLRMTVLNVTPSKTALTNQITVDVTNVSDRPISPHFSLSNSAIMSRFWTRKAGPATLGPHQRSVYELVPDTAGSRRSLKGPRILLRAVSGTPETLSSVALPMGTSTVTER